MKKLTSKSFKFIPAALCLVFCLLAHPAGAQTYYYWDNNGLATPTGGTWDTATPNWSTSSAGVASGSLVAFPAGGLPVFCAGATTAGTIEVDVNTPNLSVNGVYNNGIGGTPCALTLGGSGSLSLPAGWNTFYVSSAASNTTVNIPINGTGGLQTGGSGTLSLYSPTGSGYSGGTLLASAALTYFNNGSAFGSGTITPRLTGSPGYAPILSSGGALITLANNFVIDTANAGINFASSANTPVVCTGTWDLQQTLYLRNNGNSTAPLTLSGVISDVGGLTISANNSGTTLLSGANSYSGGTSIVQGSSGHTVQLGNASALGSGPASVASGCVLDLNGTANVNIGSTLTLNGAGISSGGALINSSSTAASLSSTTPVALASATTVGAGNITINGVVSSAGAYVLSKSGAGTLTLNNANTFTGGSQININGTIAVGNSAAVGTAQCSLAGNPSTLKSALASGTSLTVNCALTFGGGSSSAFSSTPQNILGAPGSGDLIFPGGGTAIVTGTANYKTISADGITATLSGVISGATTTRAIGWAGGNATTPGPGTIVLAAANTYTKTNVLFSGTLQVAYAENAGISGPLGKSTGAGFVVFRGGTLQYSSANNYDYSGRFSTAASQQYNIDVNGQSVTFNTALTSSGGALTLTNSTGSGTLTLTAANTYSGGTTINAGTLALGPSGSIASTPTINVAAGATLDASQPGTLTVGASQTLNSIGSVLGSLSVNGGLSAFMTTIGTNAVPSASANVTFNPSSTYVWDINKATGGTAGADPGWGLLSVPSGTITITTPLTINIVSLNGSDQPGNAANFNNAIAYSFPIAYASGGIGSFNASQVAINTAGFANYPTSASQWSVSLDNTGNYLLLNFNPFQVITTVLTNENVAAGGTAIFVVKANAAGSNPGFQWTEGSGYSPLANGGTSLGGANVSITTNGNTSTLTLSGVQDADTGSINVNVTATFNSVQQSALSSANLFVVDAPSSVSVSSTLGNTLPMTPVAQGAAIQLTATPYGGNGTLSYQWYLGATAIAGATNSFYQVNVSPATVGTYNCVVTNLAGSVTGSPAVVPGPVTSVANQMIFEPYNYIFQSNGGTGPWDGIGVTNVYNQLTGAGLGWVIGNTGSGDGACLDVNWNQHYVGSPPGIYGQFPNDNWPWEGLADSFDPGQAGILPGASGLYEQTGGAGSTHLPFGAGGSITNGTVYFSWVMNMGQGGAMTTAGHDYVGGFGYNNGDPTTFNGYPNAGIYLQTPGDDTYRLGVFKTSTGTPNPGVNGNWASSIVLIRDTTLFAVCRLTVRTNGGSSVALWIDPPTNSFYASEANVPPPDVVDSDSAGAPDAAPSADYFYDKWSADITSRNFAILRVGTTWASVTPPAAPTLSVNNVLLTPCAPATAVFTSQNAGNPVTAGYGWTFDNGGGPVALSDGPNPNNDGSAFSGTATDVLTITGVTAAEVGTYTVTGTNIDQNTVNTTPVALVGSASGTLSFLRPALSIAYNGAALVVSWPTNTPACFALNQTANLAPPVTWASASGGTAGISGTNHTYTVTPPPAAPKYYRLVGAP